jgi:CheY-like chemotaxis protein
MPCAAKIFLIDDDIDDVIFFLDAFKEKYPDIDLSSFQNPEGLMSYLDSLNEDQLPDVIISDLNMPKLNGHELLVQLKSSERYKAVPIVISSSSNNAIDKQKCIKAGAKEYIVKPLTVSQYREIVDKIIKLFIGLP